MNIYQKSFASGELTPALYGRVDLTKYSTGVRTMRNFYTARHGGAYNRPGSQYVGATYAPATRSRLIRFDVDSNTRYQLEFGHLYIRPLIGGLPIPVTSKAIFAITKAASAVVSTTLYHGFEIGDVVVFSGVTGMTEMNALTGTVSAATSVSITVNINSTGFSTFTPLTHVGTVALVTPRNVLITSPYTEDQLRELVHVQESTKLTITHQSGMPQDLTYVAAERWTLANASTEPSISAPTGVASTKPAGTTWYHGVTAVSADTFEETLVGTIGQNAKPTSGATSTITWTSVANAIEYNIYSGPSPSSMGFRSVVYINSFTDDDALQPDFTDPPPATRTMFYELSDTNMLPAAVGYFQQRKWWGNLGPPYPYAGPPTIIPSGYDPKADRVIASRIGSPTYYLLNRPTEDDDAIFFRLLNKEPQIIRHFLDLGKLAIFTEQGEWILQGGDSGAITPSTINPTNVSQNGSGYLAPIAIGSTALYVQKDRAKVRSLGFEVQIDNYKGDDVTVYASHLVDDHEIVSWDLQKSPHPIVWSARDDGVLLGTTVVPEQAILSWHRHDFTNGLVEEVCRSGDDIYLIIKRTIDGTDTRYIERFNTREYSDIKDAIFMDSSFTFDGRNTTATTVTISGGTLWDDTETLTITASGSLFSAAWDSENRALHVNGSDGTLVRLTDIAYTSATVITGKPDKVVPVTMRNTAILDWAEARTVIDGLSHLEDEDVSVIGDGFVVASPNNDEYDVLTVAGGSITLGTTAYSVVHVGLPIVADIETLNIDTAQGESILDKKKLITKVSMWVEASRGIWVGGVPPDDDSQDPLEGLMEGFDELKARYDEGYDSPNALITRVVEVNLEAQWNSHGRIFVRQIDPLPLAILSIAPGGMVPFGGG